MNPELLIRMQNQINELGETVAGIEKIIKGIKIDNQKKINANIEIPPGIGTKFAYDKNGLIISADSLSKSDIPELDIDNIKGLRKLLEEKISRSDLRLIEDRNNNNKVTDIIGTGCKINYDKNGRIVSVSDLTIEDLPNITINDINGLIDELNLIKSNINSSSSEIINYHENIINPGTYIKVSVDEYGHIVSGLQRLTENDMPIELINRINTVENEFINFAQKKVVDKINTTLSKKIDANDPITSGTYTKVRVDSNGLVTHGDKLTIKDLPELSISDIVDLDFQLRSKASQDDITVLREIVSGIMGSIDKIGDITKIKNDIEFKASSSEVSELKSRLDSIQRLIDKIVTSIPVELINTQLVSIQNSISTLEGRVTSLENIYKSIIK